MRSVSRLLLGVGILLATARSGAAQRGPLTPEDMPAAQYRTPAEMESAAMAAWARGERATARRMVATAQAYRQLGRPYLYGGTGRQRDGRIDCSALVQWAYHRAGVTIPRTSREQVRWGAPLPRDVRAMAVGDLVFFGVGTVSHVGIYLGGGYFVHASSTIGRVAVSSLEEYRWSRLWIASRRVPLGDEGTAAQRSPGDEGAAAQRSPGEGPARTLSFGDAHPVR